MRVVCVQGNEIIRSGVEQVQPHATPRISQRNLLLCQWWISWQLFQDLSIGHICHQEPPNYFLPPFDALSRMLIVRVEPFMKISTRYVRVFLVIFDSLLLSCGLISATDTFNHYFNSFVDRYWSLWPDTCLSKWEDIRCYCFGKLSFDFTFCLMFVFFIHNVSCFRFGMIVSVRWNPLS